MAAFSCTFTDAMVVLNLVTQLSFLQSGAVQVEFHFFSSKFSCSRGLPMYRDYKSQLTPGV